MTGRGLAGSPYAALWVLAACAVGALAVWLSLPPAAVEQFMGETGPVEQVTAASYAACAIAVWGARVPQDDWRSAAAASIVLAGFCMRELDWHRVFTGTSVLRLSWYGGPAGIGAKALAGFIVLLVLVALLWLLRTHSRTVWQGWRARRPIAVTMLVFLLTLVVSKTLDRSVSILIEDFGVDVTLSWKALRTAFEEWFELALSALVMLALMQRRQECRAAG